MASETFPEALDMVLRHEGGFSDHPRDPGGATNMGITIGTLRDWRGKPVSKGDVRNLTLDEAGEIYKARYWDACRCDDLPAGVDYCVFDGAVNSGPSRSAKWLQVSVEAAPDGVIGPQTIKCVAAVTPPDIIRRYTSARLAFLRSLSTWGTFGRGWKRRVDEMEAHALNMVADGHTDSHSAVRPVLRQGDTGEAVEALQAALGHIAADGIFGPQTHKALRAYQYENGLIVDGIAGPQTWGALEGESNA